MKIILAGGAILIVVMAVLLVVMEPANAPAPEPTETPIVSEEKISTTTEELPTTKPPMTEGKLKADMFTGKLEEVNTGCFADGECYVTVGGKHVTVIMGWSQETVGTIIGSPSIGDLEGMIGKDIEVYAQELTDGTYTLYGSEGFYVKVLNWSEDAGATSKCVVGGCSGQLCTDATNGNMVTTCEYRSVYACYKTARCERQASGQCGWTETDTLKACIANDGQTAE